MTEDEHDPMARWQKTGKTVKNLVVVEFSRPVRHALSNIAAAMDASGAPVAPEVYDTIRDWADGNKNGCSVEGVIRSMPMVMEQVCKHIQEHGDKQAQKALDELTNAMCEVDIMTLHNYRWREAPKGRTP